MCHIDGALNSLQQQLFANRVSRSRVAAQAADANLPRAHGRVYETDIKFDEASGAILVQVRDEENPGALDRKTGSGLVHICGAQ